MRIFIVALFGISIHAQANIVCENKDTSGTAFERLSILTNPNQISINEFFVIQDSYHSDTPPTIKYELNTPSKYQCQGDIDSQSGLLCELENKNDDGTITINYIDTKLTDFGW